MSMKQSKDKAIAATFKHEIASAEKDIEILRSSIEELKKGYKRMISEDLEICSSYGPEDLAKELVSRRSKLVVLTEKLENAIHAYEDWKEFAAIKKTERKE